jgi:hypothetical protein
MIIRERQSIACSPRILLAAIMPPNGLSNCACTADWRLAAAPGIMPLGPFNFNHYDTYEAERFGNGIAVL